MTTPNEEVIEHLKTLKNTKVRDKQERIAHAIGLLKQGNLAVSMKNIELIALRLSDIEKRLILGMKYEINIFEGLEEKT